MFKSSNRTMASYHAWSMDPESKYGQRTYGGNADRVGAAVQRLEHAHEAAAPMGD